MDVLRRFAVLSVLTAVTVSAQSPDPNANPFFVVFSNGSSIGPDGPWYVESDSHMPLLSPILTYRQVVHTTSHRLSRPSRQHAAWHNESKPGNRRQRMLLPIRRLSSPDPYAMAKERSLGGVRWS